MLPFRDPAPTGPTGFWPATLVGGFVAGLLDIVYAFLVYGLIGVGPAVILQSIASGLLGPPAYSGGAGTAVLGLAMHFLMTLIMAAIYVAASRHLPALRRRTILCGGLYGLVIYLVMNFIVLPLSAYPAPGGAQPLWMLIGGLAIHAFGVGVSIAWAARRFGASAR